MGLDYFILEELNTLGILMESNEILVDVSDSASYTLVDRSILHLATWLDWEWRLRSLSSARRLPNLILACAAT